jgi:LPXTG-motif cell wall-anchored protein
MRKRFAAAFTALAMVIVPTVVAFASHEWIAVPGTISGYSAAISDSGNIVYVGRVDAFSPHEAKVWKSTNGGTSWSVLSNSPDRFSWLDLETSADGAEVVGLGYTAGASQTRPYRSDDSGSTWSVLSNAPNLEWVDLAMSSNGKTIIGGSKYSGLWTSDDFGANWSDVAPASGAWWTGVAVSSNGQRMAAAHVTGGIWVSSNAGATWTRATGTNIANWWAIAMSGDGSRLVALNDDDVPETVGNDGLWTSTDSGATWTRSSLTVPLRKVAVSRDGTTMAASLYGGELWLSHDSGSTWTVSSLGNSSWTAIAINASGERIVAVPEMETLRVGVSTTTTTTTTTSTMLAPSSSQSVPSTAASSTSSSSTVATTATAPPTSLAATTTTTVADSPPPNVTPAMISSFSSKSLVKQPEAPAGGTVNIRISGFQPSELVSIGFDTSSVQSQAIADGVRAQAVNKPMLTVRADSTGTISVEAKVPATTSGSMTLWAYGRESKIGFRQEIKVSALPQTGSDSGGLIVNAIALLGVGTLLVASRRRRVSGVANNGVGDRQ